MAEMAWLATGGFLGAMARYGMQTFFSTRLTAAWPMGTLLVNILGSFLLGSIVGMGIVGSLTIFLGAGFMGAFTTFSTLNLEIVQLFQQGKGKVGIIYLALTYILGIGAAWLGFFIAGSCSL